jgi:hypothetical protein
LQIGNRRFAQGDLVGFLGNLATEMNPEARMSLTTSQVRFGAQRTALLFFSFLFFSFFVGLADLRECRIPTRWW